MEIEGETTIAERTKLWVSKSKCHEPFHLYKVGVNLKVPLNCLANLLTRRMTSGC